MCQFSCCNGMAEKRRGLQTVWLLPNIPLVARTKKTGLSLVWGIAYPLRIHSTAFMGSIVGFWE